MRTGQWPAARDQAMIRFLDFATAAGRGVVAVPDVLEAAPLQCLGDVAHVSRTHFLNGDDVRFCRANRIGDRLDPLGRTELADVPGKQIHGKSLIQGEHDDDLVLVVVEPGQALIGLFDRVAERVQHGRQAAGAILFRDWVGDLPDWGRHRG